MAHKCYFCGSVIESVSEEVPYKNRYAHKNCFNAAVKATAEKKAGKIAEKSKKTPETKKTSRTELKDALSESEYKDKIELFNYIRELTNVKEMSAKIYKLTDDYIKKYNFTYRGIKDTLYYYFALCNHEISGDCIGIVPYYYDEAKRFFDSYKESLNKNETKDFNLSNQIRHIKIKPPVIIPNLISIENIGVLNDE